MKSIARELNSFSTIAAREIIRFLKSPGSIITNLLFPILTLGIMGGSLSQNLAGDTGYNFLQFVMVGMLVFNMFMGSVSGITSLVVEREMNLTQELYVAPISRYTIILGKMVGTSFSSLLTLAGVFIVALLMHIPLGGIQMVRLILALPAFCLVGASLGLIFIGIVHDAKLAQMGTMLIIMPQMFFSGTIIPISHSSGFNALLSKLMPLTYVTDLARGVFYWKEPVYDLVVLHHPVFNIIVMSIFFILFFTAGTFLFTNSEKNK